MTRIVVPALAIGLCAISAHPALARSHGDNESCSANRNWDHDRANYAESREQHLAAASLNSINSGPNGSIRVYGWDKADVFVRACIQTSAPTDAEAQQLASQVRIANGPGDIEASGPEQQDDSYWGVSYEVWVPAASNLKLEASNGSIRVEGVRGQLRAQSLNGSVHLNAVGGDVDVSATNGSLDLDLTRGGRPGWTSSGIKLSTVNGSVRLTVPRDFSARVEASTVNGSVHTDFPVTITGDVGK